MKVSVIVPNFNHSKFLNQRIESILNQTYQDFEIILLDDCSTDDSVEILKKFVNNCKVQFLFCNSKNSGSPFGLWKKGFDLARGDLIWIAESDDWCEIDFLDSLIPFFSDSSVSLAYSNSDYFDEPSQQFKPITWLKSFENFLWDRDFVYSGMDLLKEYGVYKCLILNVSCAIFRKSSLKNMEFPFKFRFSGDWYFWNQLFLTGNIGFNSRILNHVRIHQGSATHFLESNEFKKLLENTFVVKSSFLLIDKPFIYSNNLNWLVILWKKYIYKHPFVGVYFFIRSTSFQFLFSFLFKKN
ncbi:glycosyltransferase family 2 protein [Algoriphagus sp. AK58]|uniref:glycosyltransferase family 2 protein n=1 Tax=Algoriphagus sp. AK58 TaxID=1406877 RepID=UPI0016500AC0|nr:glycosyltransferase family 2 protein [Algoriphagus sp. AK58]